MRWVTSAVTGLSLGIGLASGLPENAHGRLGLRDQPPHRQVLSGKRALDPPALSPAGEQEEEGAAVQEGREGQRDAGQRRLAEAGGNLAQGLGGGQRVLEA